MTAYQSTQQFQPYLLTGERILWTGQPKQGLTLSGRDVFLIPFSLLWCGFVIFWNVAVWSFPSSDGTDPGWFFKLWGLPFLVAGIWALVGRFFQDAYLRKHMFYAITDQRILVLRRSKITSLDIDRLPRLELAEHRDGTGTLTFEASNFGPWGGGMNGFSWWLPSAIGSTQFFHISEPRRVYELVRNHSRA